MRGKLKYGVGASMPTIDKLAANEASLFHALGTEGAALCLKMLGKDDSAAGRGAARKRAAADAARHAVPVPGHRRGHAERQSRSRLLTSDEMRAFEASLAREGLNFKDVSTGAYLNNAGAEPGKPCLTLETLHLAIARLAEGTRRKIYAGMFFLGRDK